MTNKFVKEEKAYLRKLLSGYKDKVVNIVDDKGEYEILTRSRRRKLRSWYVSYIKMDSRKIPLIYTTKKQSDYRRNGA